LASCSSKETQALLEPSQALGTILAEETAKSAGSKKQIAIISPDNSWGPISSAEESFKAALKKNGLSVVAARRVAVGDPMRSGSVGLNSSDFFEVVEKFPDAGAIVSFAGAPLLRPNELSRATAQHAPVMVVATAMLGNVPGVPGDRRQLAALLEANVIQLAIIDGGEQTDQTQSKADSQHQIFARNFRILRAGPQP
jgi:hypothetical protein